MLHHSRAAFSGHKVQSNAPKPSSAEHPVPVGAPAWPPRHHIRVLPPPPALLEVIGVPALRSTHQAKSQRCNQASATCFQGAGHRRRVWYMVEGQVKGMRNLGPVL